MHSFVTSKAVCLLFPQMYFDLEIHTFESYLDVRIRLLKKDDSSWYPLWKRKLGEVIRVEGKSLWHSEHSNGQSANIAIVLPSGGKLSVGNINRVSAICLSWSGVGTFAFISSCFSLSSMVGSIAFVVKGLEAWLWSVKPLGMPPVVCCSSLLSSRLSNWCMGNQIENLDVREAVESRWLHSPAVRGITAHQKIHKILEPNCSSNGFRSTLHHYCLRLG